MLARSVGHPLNHHRGTIQFIVGQSVAIITYISYITIFASFSLHGHLLGRTPAKRPDLIIL